MTGLPCDVAELLGSKCVSCHGNPPVANAPMPLLSAADLAAPAKSDATRSMAELALERVRSTSAPMPPGVRLSDAESQPLADWIAQGMPAGECAGTSDPYDTPVMCSSGEYWENGDKGSERMHPGVACISCHERGVNMEGELEHGPDFLFAGTVFPSAHEPDDCNGVDGEDDETITIEVSDADGNVLRAQANRAGNFSREAEGARLRFPITARVLYRGRSREMAVPQDSADCNSCHTEQGENGAPGRILLP